MRSYAWLSLLCLHCGLTPATNVTISDATAQSEQGIIGGTADNGKDPEIYGLILQTSQGMAICSSTLIGSRTLLTAAHCTEATQIYASNADDLMAAAHNPSQLLNVVEMRPHPQWDSQHNDAGYDVALLLLEHPVAQKPKQWNSTAIDSLVGKPIRMVGYGVQDDRQTSGEKMEVAQTFASIDSQFLKFDQSNGHGACFGDSGGPALYTFPDGVERVVGVTSFGEDQCQFNAYYTRLDTYDAFITQWLTEKETATCAQDGLCKQGCAMPDIDCVCGADGTCSAQCPDSSLDPDCDKDCGANKLCAVGSCATPDPDCVAPGDTCDNKNQCPGRECRTDDQHDNYYCSAKCDSKTACPDNLVCTSGYCLYAQLPEADLGEKCTKGKTYCTGGGAVCAKSVCVMGCESDSDCDKTQLCSGKDGTQRYCEDKPKTPDPSTAPQAKTPDNATTTDATKQGCAQTSGGSLWIVLAALSLLLRRRARA
jgi:V8-like Glu-specific endopeptidase